MKVRVSEDDTRGNTSLTQVYVIAGQQPTWKTAPVCPHTQLQSEQFITLFILK